MIPNKYNRAAEHRGLHRGESLSIRNVFPKGVRVTTVDARTHAVDSVSRKTYFSKYYKTAAPRPTMTSSCKSNPGRRWILQQNVCNSKSPSQQFGNLNRNSSLNRKRFERLSWIRTRTYNIFNFYGFIKRKKIDERLCFRINIFISLNSILRYTWNLPWIFFGANGVTLNIANT